MSLCVESKRSRGGLDGCTYPTCTCIECRRFEAIDATHGARAWLTGPLQTQTTPDLPTYSTTTITTILHHYYHDQITPLHSIHPPLPTSTTTTATNSNILLYPFLSSTPPAAGLAVSVSVSVANTVALPLPYYPRPNPRLYIDFLTPPSSPPPVSHIPSAPQLRAHSESPRHNALPRILVRLILYQSPSVPTPISILHLRPAAQSRPCARLFQAAYPSDGRLAIPSTRTGSILLQDPLPASSKSREPDTPCGMAKPYAQDRHGSTASSGAESWTSQETVRNVFSSRPRHPRPRLPRIMSYGMYPPPPSPFFVVCAPASAHRACLVSCFALVLHLN